MATDLPYLDLTANGFSTRSAEVYAARDAAWCARTPYGLAVLRYAQAGQILRDRRFRQGSHAWPDLQGLDGSFAAFWRRSVISQEGATHKAQRRIVLDALAEADIHALIPDFTAIAEDLVAACPTGQSFDFVAQVSEPFAGRAITALLGLPQTEAAALARDASALGLAMGIGSKQHEPVFNAACDRLMALAGQLLNRAEATAPPGFVTRLWQAACAQGMTDRQVLMDLIVISIFGGVDTTRAQLAFAIAQFIDHPAQWQALRHDPGLAENAVEEVIRIQPTTTWSTREAVEDVTIGAVEIKRGETLHILTHATATDPSVEPEQGFDITRQRKRHFGFGGGAHHCLGQLVARTDMACALRVLAAHWPQIHWAGTPDWLPDSGNTSATSLPIRV